MVAVARPEHVPCAPHLRIHKKQSLYCRWTEFEDSIEELDLSLPTPRWRILPQRLKVKRTFCQAVIDPRDKNSIIVVGGKADSRGPNLAACEVVWVGEGKGKEKKDKNNNSKGKTKTGSREIPPMKTPRSAFSLVVVGNRLLSSRLEAVLAMTFRFLTLVLLLTLPLIIFHRQWQKCLI